MTAATIATGTAVRFRPRVARRIAAPVRHGAYRKPSVRPDTLDVGGADGQPLTLDSGAAAVHDVAVPARTRRLRPALLALSALVGVALAGGGTLLAENRPADRHTANVATTPRPTPQPVPTTSPTTTATQAAPPTPTTTTTTTSVVPTTTTVPPPPSVADQVLALVNAARAEASCGPVAVHAALVSAAQGHADDMATHDYFSHESQDGRTFVDRATAAGYPHPGAENIAKGQPDAASVMAAWLDSPGHRANILNCELTTIGLGLNTDGMYWVQLFGR